MRRTTAWRATAVKPAAVSIDLGDSAQKANRRDRDHGSFAHEGLHQRQSRHG
jgi:hypothetical protein